MIRVELNGWTWYYNDGKGPFRFMGEITNAKKGEFRFPNISSKMVYLLIEVFA